MLKLYQILTTLLAPLISLYIFRRKLRGKEDLARFSERLGQASKPRPEGKLVWVHAASVGETISILPLIERMAHKYPGLNFLLTSGTVTSAKLVESRLPPATFHQYIPIDRLPYVKKFLSHWQPDLALWVESELWPNLVTAASKRCPMALVNGRMSDSSFKTWQKYRGFIASLLGNFTLCLAQSRQDGERLEVLGAKNVKYPGNLKYDAPALPYSEKMLVELQAQISGRPVWLAASTHKGEEIQAVDVHEKLKETFPDILTIIVPRHATRKDEILDDISYCTASIAVRSSGDEITAQTGIYIADTMGELGLFFRISKIVFMGNSLIKGGGHNPLEPARIGCAVLCGPHTFNFAEITHEFLEKNAILQVGGREALAGEIAALLKNKEKTEKLVASSLALVQEKNHILDNIIEEIEKIVQV